MRLFSLTVATACMAAIATASAADLGARGGRVASSPMVAPAIAHTWTGCFVGANAGYGIAPTDWSITGTSIAAGSHDATGAVVGGQIGCDLQTGNFVVGIEGLIDWAGLDGNHRLAGVGFETETNWYATVTGRAGLAVDRALLYVRGGAAFISNDFTLHLPGVHPAGDETKAGWTIGAGAEWAFAPGWSARLEYNYMDFGGATPNLCALGICAEVFDIDQNMHTFTVGVNYRFR